MSRNEKLYEAALNAIKELFSDTSVSQGQAKRNLRALAEEIDMMCDTLGDE